MLSSACSGCVACWEQGVCDCVLVSCCKHGASTAPWPPCAQLAALLVKIVCCQIMHPHFSKQSLHLPNTRCCQILRRPLQARTMWAHQHATDQACPSVTAQPAAADAPTAPVAQDSTSAGTADLIRDIRQAFAASTAAAVAAVAPNREGHQAASTAGNAARSTQTGRRTTARTASRPLPLPLRGITLDALLANTSWRSDTAAAGGTSSPGPLPDGMGSFAMPLPGPMHIKGGTISLPADLRLEVASKVVLSDVTLQGKGTACRGLIDVLPGGDLTLERCSSACLQMQNHSGRVSQA